MEGTSNMCREKMLAVFPHEVAKSNGNYSCCREGFCDASAAMVRGTFRDLPLPNPASAGFPRVLFSCCPKIWVMKRFRILAFTCIYQDGCLCCWILSIKKIPSATLPQVSMTAEHTQPIKKQIPPVLFFSKQLQLTCFGAIDYRSE